MTETKASVVELKIGVDGLSEMEAKIHQLLDLIKQAKSLANDLAVQEFNCYVVRD